MTVLALAGCWTLTTDLDVGGTAEPGEEAGVPVGDSGGGGSEDGPGPSTDASSPDGESLIDASRADALPDGAPLGFCEGYATPPRICDDFDTGSLGSKWTRIEDNGSGASTLGTTIFKSAPNAYVAKIPSGCSAGHAAQLIDEAPGQPAEVKIDFDVSIAPMGAQPNINLAGIQYLQSGSPGFYRVDVAFRDTHLEIHQNPPFAVLGTSEKVFPFDTFKHVSIIFTFVGSPRVIVKVEGATELDEVINAPLPTNNETKLDIGVYAGSACQGAIEARFDNVLYFVKTR